MLVYSYCIAADNRIAWVSEEWLEFARQNQAPELTREHVVGRPLFSFVSGAETEYLYYMLLDRVRSLRETVSVSFRCDSPLLRRFMTLRVSPLAKERVQFDGLLVRAEPRQAVSLLDAAAARALGALTICGWCKKVQVDDEWLEVEVAVERLDLFGASQVPRLSHGVCDSCGGDVRRLAEGAGGG